MPRARHSSGTRVIYQQHWPADPVSPLQAQLIAQSIGQAFSVAYQEFLRANGINPEDLSQKEYSDIINTQEMYNDDLIHFSNSENCKEVGDRGQEGALGQGPRASLPGVWPVSLWLPPLQRVLVCEECGAVRAEELPIVRLNDSELVPFTAALSQGLSPWCCFWKACGSGLGSLP